MPILAYHFTLTSIWPAKAASCRHKGLVEKTSPAVVVISLFCANFRLH